jgi:hypothetical protein
MSPTTLVFTVAINGYADKYFEYVESQRKYSDRHAYTYLAITEPSGLYGPSEAAWLKVRVAAGALTAGYDRVLCLDCDAEVFSNAPSLDLTMNRNRWAYIHMTRGHSGRYNSGVIMVRNGYPARGFFAELWRRIGTPLAQSDDVGWGENGHVIQLSKEVDCIAELPRSWNNTYLPLPDPEYIRHHTGPIRDNEERAMSCSAASNLHASRLSTHAHDATELRVRATALAREYEPLIPLPPTRT